MVRIDWTGREEAARLAGAPPRAKLRKVPELSTGEGRSGSAIIHADNFPAVAALTPALGGQVDLAFIDPPYTRRGSAGATQIGFSAGLGAWSGRRARTLCATTSGSR